MSVRAVLRTGLSGVGGLAGQGSDAGGSGFEVGGRPGGGAARAVALEVADLRCDLAEAGRDEAGRALRYRDTGTGDGVPVVVPVQGAENAVRLYGSRLGCRGDGFGAVNGVLQCGGVP